MKLTNKKKKFSIFSSVFEIPGFIDFLIDNGWMIEYIAVEKKDEYGKGYMYYFSVNGNIRLFIENHILRLKEIKLILIYLGQVHEIIITPEAVITNLDENVFKQMIKYYKEKQEEYRIKKIREDEFIF
ncbi:MAG: hypothetical protein ACP6IS_02485 [Candidatus Asgardarchaeia archaeon]